MIFHFIPYQLKQQLRLKRVRARYSSSCRIETPIVNESAILGNGVYLAENVSIRGGVEIGDYSYCSSGSIVFKNSKIGKFCSIGYNVQIGPPEHPSKYLSTSPSIYRDRIIKETFPWAEDDIRNPVVIGNDCWIGSNAIILQGVKVGNGAIIGAGAVVTKDIPPYEIWGGVPAVYIKNRFNKQIVDFLLDSKWWDHDIEWIRDFVSKNASYMKGELE